MISAQGGCLSAYHTICINADGTLDPCCQYQRQHGITPIYHFTEFEKYQQTTQQQLHQANITKTPDAGCSKCYTEEVRNWSSLRTHFQRWFGTNAADEVKSNNPIYDVELRLGNYCNLKCFSCFPGSSSTLAQERTQYKDKFDAIGIFTTTINHKHYWETPEFLAFIKFALSDVKRINITGGEPFIIPEIPNILDQLLHKKDTVSLNFNTNLTRLSSKLINRLQQFKNLQIAVSLEGIGSKNEYLRYPSRWKDIEKNIEIIRTQIPTATLSVNHTFQHASVYALPDLAKFCYDNSIPMHLTLVQGDDSFTLNSVPELDLNKFKSWVTDTDLLNNEQRQLIINTIQSSTYNVKLHKKYYKYTQLLDEIRGTDYYGVFDNETKYVDN